MNPSFHILLLILFSVTMAAQEIAIPEWLVDGKLIKARLIGRYGDSVIIEGADGKRIVLQYKKLTDEEKLKIPSTVEGESDEDKRYEKFGGLTWGMIKKDVVEKLSGKNYELIFISDDKLRFKGKLFESNADIFCVFDDAGLTEIFVTIPVDESLVFKLYNDVKASLTPKYGKPEGDYKLFTKPYYEGDGFEASAIRLGKAAYMAVWEKNRIYQLIMPYENGMAIGLKYYSARSGALDKQEKEYGIKKSKKDL